MLTPKNKIKERKVKKNASTREHHREESNLLLGRSSINNCSTIGQRPPRSTAVYLLRWFNWVDKSAKDMPIQLGGIDFIEPANRVQVVASRENSEDLGESFESTAV
jgi:hypothetical protein